MNQSNFIAGALFVAFVVYITTKGELPRYLGFFGLASSSGAQATTSSSSGLPSASSLPVSAFGVSNFGNLLPDVLKFWK